MKDEAHDAIRERLARQGTTHDDHVGAALKAHDEGLPVLQILDDIAAGVPQWLALLRATHAGPPHKKGKAKHGS